MGILSIMHKLHDPFNSCRPSDPSCNSPSLLSPHPRPLHAVFSRPPKLMSVLSLISSNRNSPSLHLKNKEIQTQQRSQG